MDFIDSVLDYISILNRHIYVCDRCGIILAPFLGGIMGPRSAGWHKVKKGKYLCHFCDYHFDYCNKEEIDERAEIVEKSNDEYTKKLWFWKVNYPWLSIHYKGGTKDGFEKDFWLC